VLQKIEALFSIVVGIGICGIWIMLMSAGGIAELETEPVRITLHVLSEFLTALLLIIGGVALLKKKSRAKAFFYVSQGMLIYSVLNAAGYYVQLNNAAMGIMFSVILAISAVLLIMEFAKSYAEKTE
jgi:hypothetical protein